MKKIFTLVLLGAFSLINAQAFNGKGDTKMNIGMTFQDGGSGIVGIVDFGLGENFSVGVLSSYLLSGNNIGDVDFEYRFDAKARFNANLSSALNVSPKFDLYPGLDLGLKNFGGHLGARYFFTDGIGLFAEYFIPFASYDNDAASKFNNDNSFYIGASFNIN